MIRDTRSPPPGAAHAKVTNRHTRTARHTLHATLFRIPRTMPKEHLMRRHVTTAALFSLILAGVAVIAGLLMPAPAAQAVQERPAAAVQVQTPAAPSDAFLAALVGPGTEAPANAEELLLAADRVCEGITAQVPEGFMIRTVAAEQGLTLPEAHRFVETAAAEHCTA